ncbi:MAG TPA: POTRA domain-containing protein [Bacteroidales bacterium]|nr:POTRA domain-containing protein [Bacteroidales bacterium]
MKQFSFPLPLSFLLFPVLFLFQSSQLCAQKINKGNTSGKFLIVRNINITGNNRTKASIITREMKFAGGDTIFLTDYPLLMNAARENIFNTGLFNFVTLDTTSISADKITTDVNIRLIERWYIWPWPFFELSDRNINSWLETTDYSRLTYGIDLTINNVRGRDETLKIPIHVGFNQLFGFDYEIPYINRRKTIGAGFGGDYERNHEVIITSTDNKPVYYKDPASYPRQETNVFAAFYLRPNFYAKHTFRFDYQSYAFSDSLVRIPGYTQDSLRKPQFLTFTYQYKNDHRDFHFYPLKGSYFDVTLVKNGFWQKIDELYIQTNLRKYWRLYNRWYFASGLTVKVTLTTHDAYFLQKGLGYGRDFVRGYEYYVIDGQDFGLLKNNLKFALIPQRVLAVNFLKSKKFNTVPYALYMNVFTDFGFVNNRMERQNQLNDMQNTLLVGYGAGFDFTTYYDIVLRLELAVNGRGRAGLYLHFMAPI